MGKCPGCGRGLGHVFGDNVKINTPAGQWEGISYKCPSCSCVVGCQIDPIAIKSDIVDEILRALRTTQF